MIINRNEQRFDSLLVFGLKDGKRGDINLIVIYTIVELYSLTRFD